MAKKVFCRRCGHEEDEHHIGFCNVSGCECGGFIEGDEAQVTEYAGKDQDAFGEEPEIL